MDSGFGCDTKNESLTKSLQTALCISSLTKNNQNVQIRILLYSSLLPVTTCITHASFLYLIFFITFFLQHIFRFLSFQPVSVSLSFYLSISLSPPSTLMLLASTSPDESHSLTTPISKASASFPSSHFLFLARSHPPHFNLHPSIIYLSVSFVAP